MAAVTEETPAAGTASSDAGTPKPDGAQHAPPVAANDESKAGTPSGEPARKDGEAPPPPKAPEKYTLTPPAGAESIADADLLTRFEALAKAEAWTNEEAQVALDKHVEIVLAQNARFLERTEADPTYGGEHLADTQRLAYLALDKFAPKGDAYGDEIRRVIDQNGYGNHVAFLATFARIGKLMTEDRPGAPGGARSPSRKSDADVMFGDMPAKP